ncbi:putative oxidoreductase [Glycine max]|nr:putative oxidoreductase [Glycine max]
MLLPPTHMALHSPRLLSLTRRAFSSSPSSFQGGVSMVQGASRGIGLEFVKQILEYDDKEHVIATCRNPSASTGLIHLKDKFADRLKILSLDLTVETSIEASALSIKETYGRLNLLINASGILSIPEVMHPETTLNKVEKSSLMLAYEVNAVGPILVIKHMWPLLKVGGGHGTGRSAAVVASLSARVASIGDNRLGVSKTASLEFARRKDPVVCILLHPGTVDTDLSKPFQRNVPPDKLFTKEFSVQKLLSIINNVKIHDNGKFFAWDGQEIPW